jgi:hypothetical protein
VFPVKVPVSSACTKPTDDDEGLVVVVVLVPVVVVVLVGTVVVVVLGGTVVVVVLAAQVATSGVDHVPCKVPPEQFTVTDWPGLRLTDLVVAPSERVVRPTANPTRPITKLMDTLESYEFSCCGPPSSVDLKFENDRESAGLPRCGSHLTTFSDVRPPSRFMKQEGLTAGSVPPAALGLCGQSLQ